MATNPTPVMENLASALVQDIFRKGLQVGDRYLGDKEAARMLRVSSVTANRAMKLLAQRRIIVRRQRAGTFIGPNAPRQADTAHRMIHFLMSADFKAEWPLSDTMVKGLQKYIPDAQVQINTIPANDVIGFLCQFTNQIASSHSTAGIVLTSTTRQVRQFFVQHNLPVVVCGHVESDIDLPWVDRNQYRIGELIAEHFLEMGHRRFALLMRDHWAPGDNLLVDGVSQKLSTQNTIFTIRSAPAEADLVCNEVRLMLQGPHRPTAIVCRSSRLAHYVADTVVDLGINIPSDLVIGVATPMPEAMSIRGLSCYVAVDLFARGEAIGRMLTQMNGGEKPGHCEMPATLEVSKYANDLEK